MQVVATTLTQLLNIVTVAVCDAVFEAACLLLFVVVQLVLCHSVSAL